MTPATSTGDGRNSKGDQNKLEFGNVGIRHNIGMYYYIDRRC